LHKTVARARSALAFAIALRQEREMSLPLTLEEALARGEVLAANTTESIRVVRVAQWVYKFLKPLADVGWQPRETYVRQLRLRRRASHAWPEFNPLYFLEREWLVTSRFVAGREATLDECRGLARQLRDSGRGYVQDVGQPNVRVLDGRLVVVDFLIAEDHPDWLSAQAIHPPNLMETLSCL
jgi:hypothetical protein